MNRGKGAWRNFCKPSELSSAAGKARGKSGWWGAQGLNDVSLVLTGGAAVVIGGLLGKLTGDRWMRSAMRQLLVVALASVITFLIGKLFGTTVF